MKVFLYNQFRSFRKHSRLLLVILVMFQAALIGLMMLANASLKEAYEVSIEDNVTLFMENYSLKQNCPPPSEPDEDSSNEQQSQQPSEGTTRI